MSHNRSTTSIIKEITKKPRKPSQSRGPRLDYTAIFNNDVINSASLTFNKHTGGYEFSFKINPIQLSDVRVRPYSSRQIKNLVNAYGFRNVTARIPETPRDKIILAQLPSDKADAIDIAAVILSQLSELDVDGLKQSLRRLHLPADNIPPLSNKPSPAPQQALEVIPDAQPDLPNLFDSSLFEMSTLGIASSLYHPLPMPSSLMQDHLDTEKKSDEDLIDSFYNSIFMP